MQAVAGPCANMIPQARPQEFALVASWPWRGFHEAMMINTLRKCQWAGRSFLLTDEMDRPNLDLIK